MKRFVAIIICLVFLVSGLIRMGVSALMMGQAMDWWAFEGEAVEALAETRRFIADRDVNMVGFTPISYFAFIMFMGVTISLGAIGQLWRKNWGLILIGIYIVSHGLLFVNFMTVNPKVVLWGLSVVAALVLLWANGPDRSVNMPQTARR